MTREKWKELTAHEQRVKVAEHDNLTFTDDEQGQVERPERVYGRTTRLPQRPERNGVGLRERLSEAELSRYYNELAETIGMHWSDSGTIDNPWHLIRATAAQRAEAFVLVMEKEKKKELHQCPCEPALYMRHGSIVLGLCLVLGVGV